MATRRRPRYLEPWIGLAFSIAPVMAQEHAAPIPMPNPSYSDQPAVEVRNGELRYSGLLNAMGLDRVRALLPQHPDVDVLRIRSAGGEGLDGIEVAKLVHARGMSVIVEDRCNSACANHIFVPAARKTILPGAMVIWHNACPDNIPPEYRGTDTIDGKVRNITFSVYIDGKRATDEQVEALGKRQRRQLNRSTRDFFRRYADANEAFFASRPQIDPRVICLGDYLEFPSGNAYAYTLSVADMEKFGVCNVHAPEDYTSQVMAALRHEGLADHGGVVDLSDYPEFSPRYPAGGCSEQRARP